MKTQAVIARQEISCSPDLIETGLQQPIFPPVPPQEAPAPIEVDPIFKAMQELAATPAAKLRTATAVTTRCSIRGCNQTVLVARKCLLCASPYALTDEQKAKGFPERTPKTVVLCGLHVPAHDMLHKRVGDFARRDAERARSQGERYGRFHEHGGAAGNTAF